MAIHVVSGVELTVIDGRQDESKSWNTPSRYAGPIATAMRTSEIEMRSVAQVVRDILVRISAATPNPKKIARLNIVDHGGASGFEMGDDRITNLSLGKHAAELAKLKPHFASGGIAHLQHCYIGQNKMLLLRFAAALGVPVYATPNLSNPVFGVAIGGPGVPLENYVRAQPDGTFEENVGRPEIRDPNDLRIDAHRAFLPVMPPIEIDL